MTLPLLLTANTGVLYQITDLSGHGQDWSLEMHKESCGIIKLKIIYPLLNALAVFALLTTRISMYLQMRRSPRKRLEEP